MAGRPALGAATTVDLGPYLDPAVSTDWLGVPDSLAGPNAVAWADLVDDSTPDTDGSPGRAGSFVFAVHPVHAGRRACDAGHVCTWKSDTPFSWQTNQDNDITNGFWLVNRFHDHLKDDPQIAFGPSSGNFEGDDPVVMNGLDGAAGPDDNGVPGTARPVPPQQREHAHAARRLEPAHADVPGGRPAGVSQRDVSFDYDPATVWHEYTHGLSTRLVANGGVSSPQAGAMGEAWSDWYALDWMDELGMITGSGPGAVDLGIYADPVKHETRTQPLDCPVGVNDPDCPGRPPRTPAGGYTYASFGKISSRGAEVHADGEIWSEKTLWDLRETIGQDAAQKVITDGMRLSVTEPSFLDMRNAILAADQADFGGANEDDIWTVFAHRGMGFFAGAVDGGDVNPVADFSTPPAAGTPSGTVTGRVLDQDTGQPVAGAVVGFGGHDSAGYQTTTGADGRFTLTPVQGTYPSFFIRGPGYDAPSGLPATVDVNGGTRRISATGSCAATTPAARAGPRSPRRTTRGPGGAARGRHRRLRRRPGGVADPDGTRGRCGPTPPGVRQGTPPYRRSPCRGPSTSRGLAIVPAETCRR